VRVTQEKRSVEQSFHLPFHPYKPPPPNSAAIPDSAAIPEDPVVLKLYVSSSQFAIGIKNDLK
jgi:hypothetical protein